MQSTVTAQAPVEEWSWRQYDSAHGGEHAETNSDESEQSRYAPIQARLAQEEQQREVNEDTILWHNESLAGWQTRGKGYAICPYISRLRHLAKVAEDVKTSRRARLAAERLHTSAHESCADMYPRLCHKTKVRIGCYGDPEAVEATVFMSLYSASYYGGHQGGDYIFRHLPDEPEDDTEPTSLSLSEELESVRFTLNVNDEEAGLKRSFVYCGQVPRPPREYLERLKVVSRDIMQLLSGIFSEFPDVTSAQMEIFQPGRRVSGPVFGKLCSAYRSVIQTADRKAVARVRGKLRDCPRVLEFAHLLHKLSAAEIPQVTYYMRPLIKALEEATGWTFFEMIDAADLEAARKATRLLLHEKRLEHIFLFQTREDENTSDIHKFYTDDVFRNAPNHPDCIYTRLDVREALELFDGLRRDIDADPRVADFSDFELSDAEPEAAQGCPIVAVEELLYKKDNKRRKEAETTNSAAKITDSNG